ncbi:MAG: Holliday junction resolvase RuvX [Candidatus Gastranaerophilales bacterium]|nr:Holliday junction resolvase RuvX [Candidatus Gastranaerophilales bacterium]
MDNKLNRILALDIGDKRIGAAFSDPFGLFVSKSELILRENDKKALDLIEKLCIENNVQKILIGVPYNMDGSFGFQAKKNVEFIEPLKEKYEIIYRDERLTSFQAEEALKLEGAKYTKNKGLVDMRSACIILEDYLGEQ